MNDSPILDPVLLALLLEAITIIVAIGISWGIVRTRIKNLEDDVKDLKRMLQEHEAHSVGFREDTIREVSFLKAKINGE